MLKKAPFFMLALVFLTCTLLFQAGCSPNRPEGKEEPQETATGEPGSFPLQAEDHLERTVWIEKKPQRIIAMAPSHTEILFALGLEEECIAVTDYCDYPPAAKEKETVGGFTDPSLEKIVSLEPDLVLGVPYQEELLHRLEEFDIPVLALEPKSLQELFSTIETIGKATGSPDKGEGLSRSMQHDINAIVEKVEEIPGEERPAVFFEIWHDPLQTVGKQALLFEVLELISGEVITDPAGGEYPHFSLEQLFQKDPDFYFATRGSMSDYRELSERPGWDALTAAQKGNVHIISDENTVYRAGPRIVKGMEEMFQALYPEQ